MGFHTLNDVISPSSSRHSLECFPRHSPSSTRFSLPFGIRHSPSALLIASPCAWPPRVQPPRAQLLLCAPPAHHNSLSAPSPARPILVILAVREAMMTKHE